MPVVITAGNASGLLVPRARWSYRDYSTFGGRQTFSSERQGDSQTGDRTYYDAANQLRLVQREGLVPGGAIKLKEEMWYDALGRRVLVRAYRTGNCTRADGSCAETIARFIWDGAQVLGELRANGATGAPLETQVSTGTYTGRVRYVHAPVWRGIDAPLSASKDGTLIVPHADWRGLPLAGSTASGALASTGIAWPGAAARIRIDPAMPLAEWWGTLLADQQDATGRRYRRARYYDPAIGQFASEDPIGLAGGRHPYAYADGDPVNYSDPFGLCTIQQRLCHWIEATSIALGSLGGFVVGGGGPALTGVGVLASPFTAAAGAATGAGIGLAAGKAITGALFSEDASAGRSGGSESSTSRLQRRLDEHRQKLEDYRRDPDAFDNQGLLRNAPNKEIRNRIIQSRIRHLETEIRAFEKGIRDAGGTPR